VRAHRWITIGALAALFVLGVVGMGRVQQQFFPDSAGPRSWWTCGCPKGRRLQHRTRWPSASNSAWRASPACQSVSTWVGSGVPRFYLPLDQIFPADQRQPDHRAAQDLKRARPAPQAAPLLARSSRGARPRQAAAQRAAGAVSGAVPRGRGADPLVLRQWADEAKEVLRANPNMRGVNDNWNESIKVLRLEVDQDKARALGVTSQSIAQAAAPSSPAPPSASTARATS
jgi:multidrug efflux pump